MYNLPYLSEYAEVLINSALNLQKDDSLIIIIPDFYKNFADILNQKAKDAGVNEITIFWERQQKEYEHYKSGNKDKFIWISDEEFKQIDDSIKNNARLLIIRSTEFGIFEGLSKEQAELRSTYYMQDFSCIYYYVQSNTVAYCLGALPNYTWAKLKYPNLSEDDALNKLWDKMSMAIYLDTDNPANSWTQRVNELDRRRKLLNEKKFEAINVVGDDTSLTLGLNENHIWKGGKLTAPDGRVYIPNIPTEEVFTTPDKFVVNGKINIKHDFYFAGQMIDEYKLQFVDGACTSVESNATETADKYMKTLEKFPNGRYLGEIALVSDDSGVKQQNSFFYDMVYDENASCHFAFGNSYKNTIVNGEVMTDEEFELCGGNISQLHMDFMYDSENMIIYGVKDGEKTVIIDHGRWVL